MTRRYQAPVWFPGWAAVGAILILALLGVVITAQPAAAHPGDDEAGAASDTCGFEHPDWRNATRIEGVWLQADRSCRPDNPYRVATLVKGTNNVGMKTLMRSGLARDAVVKGNDRDGDGDPDDINVTLEVTGVNEYNRSESHHQIAPGINPPMWTFSPKGRGMVESGSKVSAPTETASPSIRVEEGDTIYVTVENTHYMPHTIHFHGVDHPYERAEGQGTRACHRRPSGRSSPANSGPTSSHPSRRGRCSITATSSRTSTSRWG